MTPEERAEIQQRVDNATEGPWWSDESDLCWRLHGIAGRIPAQTFFPEQIVNRQILKAPKKGTTQAEYWPDDADADLIVNAWSDLKTLLAEVKRLTAMADEMTARVEAADEAFKDLAQTNGGLDACDVLSRVSRIMSTLRGAVTPGRVSYDRLHLEIERLQTRLKAAEAVCVTYGVSCIGDDTYRSEALHELWDEWDDLPGDKPKPLSHAQITELAARRDAKRAEALAKSRELSGDAS